MVDEIEILPTKQRSLVFQGGGSLGAYEAGVYQVLYHWIKNDLSDNENVFDIIAGTSIGAVNASIIVNEILEKKQQKKSDKILSYWEDTPKKLIQFWKNVSSNTVTDPWDPWNLADLYRSIIENSLNFNYEMYLNIFPYIRSYLPSEEAFRKYYHTQMALASGEKQIFRPKFIYPFSTPLLNKFFDYISPTTKWFQYSNHPFRKSIQDSANRLKDDDRKGIKTIYDENEPRLLLVAVDISNAESKTFDSYKENITINHVLASAAVPKNYPYVNIGGIKYWDGGILSNTPIREVISEHSKSWVERLGIDVDLKKGLSYDKEKEYFEDNKEVQNEDKNKNNKFIPNLELFVVNLYPSKESGEQIPSLNDYDRTKERENDIRFHDKTDYDLKLANVVSDYHDFVKDIGNLTVKAIDQIKNDDKSVADLKKDFIEILRKEQRSLSREEERRYFYDLLHKRFDIVNTIEIQREDDEDTIANKALDFSTETISNLIEQGIYDTLDKLYQENDREFFNKWYDTFVKDIENQDITEVSKPIFQFKEKERL